jgi:hypothetical protein
MQLLNGGKEILIHGGLNEHNDCLSDLWTF